MTHIHADTVDDVWLEASDRMEKAVKDLFRVMASIRTGRASIALLDTIRVDYYGTMTPVNQLATLATPTPTTITVQPWDVSQIGAIERAIRMSNLGINPANDGKLIRLVIPPLTQQRRKELVRNLHRVLEQHRVAVRNVRREANLAIRQIEKAKKISKDECKRALAEVQKETDSFIKRLNAAGSVKEKEILEIR